MRVLFTSTPGLGHVYPLMPLLRAACKQGDDVLLAVAASAQHEVGALGFPLALTDDPSPEESATFWSRLADYAEPDTHVIGRWFGGIRSRAALETTRAAVERHQPDLVVSESGEFAGPLAAELADVPHVTVGVTAIGLKGFTPQLLVAELNALRRDIGLDETEHVPWRHRTRYVTAVPRMLWGGPDDAPADTLVYRHEDPEGTAPTGLHQPRPDGRRPRVYATLGSVAGALDLARGAYAAVLAALGEVDADVLFTLGRMDPAEIGPVPSNVKVERYVPQHVAMACDAVVTHAGSGTTVAALSRGLPLVAVPLFADQPHNAERVQAAGAGVAVPPEQVAERLPSAVATVLSDPTYARAARRIADDLVTLPTAGEVLARLRPVAVH
jgi:UDP:flavonoid glycosyltransferase YjiC (YdhE family)